jgi:hypothetical protein
MTEMAMVVVWVRVGYYCLCYLPHPQIGYHLAFLQNYYFPRPQMQDVTQMNWTTRLDLAGYSADSPQAGWQALN